jgi:hypothetical protein
MKNLLFSFAIGLATAFTTHAATAPYVVKSGAGNAASGAEVIFPADPSAQMRLVSIQWESDTNAAKIAFQTAVGAYSVTQTNPTTTFTTQAVTTTSGLITNRWLVLQRGLGSSALCFKALLVATNNGTNVVLDVGGWGALSAVGDSIYPLGATNTVNTGATTNWQNGEALFVGNVGRPVRVLLTPALTTNRLTTVTARYE